MAKADSARAAAGAVRASVTRMSSPSPSSKLVLRQKLPTRDFCRHSRTLFLLLSEHLLHHLIVHQRIERSGFRNGRITLALDHRMHPEGHIDGWRNVLAFLLHHRRGQRKARLIVLSVGVEDLEVRIVDLFPVTDNALRR